MTGALDRMKFLNKSLLRRVFNMFDIDQSGAIEITELKKIYGNSLEQEIYENDDDYWQKIFHEVDKNNNGEISFKEFY